MRDRRQGIRVIISETLMVIAVAITVLILAFVVSGYWLNSDFKVERQGMLQVSSVPTGADVKIDGESSWMQHTNTSKILSSGKHTVELVKEGYDSWSKEVEVKEGLLYRLHYPRLFLIEREKELVYDTKNAEFATISPNHNQLLLINNTIKWDLINLDSDTIKSRPVDISKLINPTEESESQTFGGHILSANWDNANEHLLMKISLNGASEWVLLNVHNPAESVNLSREFKTSFDEIRIFDHSANTLIATKNDNLHRIDVPGRQISAVLAEQVIGYDFFGQEIVFVGKKPIEETEGYHLAVIKNSDAEPEEVLSLTKPAIPAVVKFYDEEYLALVGSTDITLYNKEDYEVVKTESLSFAPDAFKVGFGGDFIVMRSGERIASFDMEAMRVNEWSTGTPEYGWLDSSMIYTISEGELTVYDYDGLNKRVLAKDVSSYFPVTVTANKWLYYFSDGKLVREVIAK